MRKFSFVLVGLGMLSLIVGVQTAGNAPRRIPRSNSGPCTDELLDRAIPKLSAFAKMLGLPPISRKTIWHSYCSGWEGEISVEASVNDEQGGHCGQYKDNAEHYFAVSFARDVPRARTKGRLELSKERLIQIANQYRNRLKTDRKLVFAGVDPPPPPSPERSYYGPMPTSFRVTWQERIGGYPGTAALAVALEPHTGELKSLSWAYAPYEQPKKRLLTQSEAAAVARAYVLAYHKEHPYSERHQFYGDKAPEWYGINRSQWANHRPNQFVGEYYKTIPQTYGNKHIPRRMIHIIFVKGKSKMGVPKWDWVEVDAETGKVVGGAPAP